MIKLNQSEIDRIIDMRMSGCTVSDIADSILGLSDAAFSRCCYRGAAMEAMVQQVLADYPRRIRNFIGDFHTPTQPVINVHKRR